MAYAGELPNESIRNAVDLSPCGAVVVSGDGPNICGHMLLSQVGYYFHVAELYGKPRWMDRSGFQRYLNENEKEMLGYYPVNLPDVAGAEAELKRLLDIRWAWLVAPHNCATFVEQVLQAGGADFGLVSNCPAVLPAGEAVENAVAQGIQEFITWASGGYYPYSY